MSRTKPAGCSPTRVVGRGTRVQSRESSGEALAPGPRDENGSARALMFSNCGSAGPVVVSNNERAWTVMLSNRGPAGAVMFSNQGQ